MWFYVLRNLPILFCCTTVCLQYLFPCRDALAISLSPQQSACVFCINCSNLSSTVCLVLVDVSRPLGGKVHDGSNVSQDEDYTSVDSSITCSWEGFSDPESGIAEYEVLSIVSGVAYPPRMVGTVQLSRDTSVSVRHGDRIRSLVTAINGAGSRTTVSTDGYLVDKTPPRLVSIGIENAQPRKPFYQSHSDSVTVLWSYNDDESGIDSYKVTVIELLHGNNRPVYPNKGEWADIAKQGGNGFINRMVVPGLSLVNGAVYIAKVMAINRANLAVIHASEPLTVDTTPPEVLWVSSNTYCYGCDYVHSR